MFALIFGIMGLIVMALASQPPHPESLNRLRRLREDVRQNGDECLAMLLAGVEMYAAVGREWELLEIMRKFAHESEEMVRNTPSAEELRNLYEREDDQGQGLEETPGRG